MITRRQMLARMLGGSVALAAAGIWIPGERSIFLPPVQKPITYVAPIPAELSYLDRLVGLYAISRFDGESDDHLRERALQFIRHPTTGEPRTVWCDDHYIT
jgi:hypothetical protein